MSNLERIPLGTSVIASAPLLLLGGGGTREAGETPITTVYAISITQQVQDQLLCMGGPHQIHEDGISSPFC